jgi:hypothetical protein
MGRITCWNSGNFHLEILEAKSGHDVLDQHGKIELPSALDDALRPFLSKLGIDPKS